VGNVPSKTRGSSFKCFTYLTMPIRLAVLNTRISELESSYGHPSLLGSHGGVAKPPVRPTGHHLLLLLRSLPAQTAMCDSSLFNYMSCYRGLQMDRYSQNILVSMFQSRSVNLAFHSDPPCTMGLFLSC